MKQSLYLFASYQSNRASFHSSRISAAGSLAPDARGTRRKCVDGTLLKVQKNMDQKRWKTCQSNRKKGGGGGGGDFEKVGFSSFFFAGPLPASPNALKWLAGNDRSSRVEEVMHDECRRLSCRGGRGRRFYFV